MTQGCGGARSGCGRKLNLNSGIGQNGCGLPDLSLPICGATSGNRIVDEGGLFQRRSGVSRNYGNASEATPVTTLFAIMSPVFLSFLICTKTLSPTFRSSSFAALPS